MSTNIQGLRAELRRIHEVLEEGALLEHAPELKRSLTLDVREMLEKADRQVEENLLVGLLGGTGVGKSSLMNVLAGRTIASASHRRPHTDQILVYRHVSAALPSTVTNGVALLREITHEADGVAQFVLCDLPDFDSIVSAHRRIVLDFLTHLDLLVWVVSPEKYADGGFYDFLADVPKAGTNFLFVLNKTDLLFESVPLDEGYDRLRRVSGLFAEHLRGKGVESPIVFFVSAAQALEDAAAAPWNQFAVFRQQLFQRRELKEIAAIKSANLDVEKHHLLRSLDEEILRVRSFVETLEHELTEVERGRSEWHGAAERAIDRWIRTLPLERMVGGEGPGNPALAGPALLISGIARKLHRQGASDWPPGVEAGCSDPRMALADLRRELGRIEDRLTHRVLRAGLPQPLVEEVRSVLACEERWDRLAGAVERKTEAMVSTSFIVARRGFRFAQRLCHGVVYVLFIASLLHGEPLRAMLSEPSWSGLLALLVDLVLGLFRPPGLAALGSLVVFQLYLGWRFHKRHKKWLQLRTQRFIETLKLELARVFDAELDEIVVAYRQYVARRKAAVEAFDALRGVRGAD